MRIPLFCSGRIARGSENRNQLVRLRYEILHSLLWNETRIHQQFEPEQCFVSFFNDGAQLGNELCA